MILCAAAPWLDPALASETIAQYLRFHAGAPIVAERSRASFAVIADGAMLQSLEGFAVGSLEYPDRSTTVIVQLSGLDGGVEWHLRGPGIATSHSIRLPVQAELIEAVRTNRAAFPCGVDLIFTDGSRILGLPRSTRVSTSADGEA